MYERDTGTVEHTAADAIASRVKSEEENLMVDLLLMGRSSWLRLRTTCEVLCMKSRSAHDKRKHNADDSEHMDVYNKDISLTGR